jgi:uncharacterized protein YbjT (DUF2867 family)
MSIVVAGATGNVGSGAVRKLAELGGVSVKALTRAGAGDKAGPLKDLANVQIVECDIGDKSSLAGVLDGATGALLTCGNFQGP